MTYDFNGKCPICDRYVGELFIWRGMCAACRADAKINKRGGAVSYAITNKLNRLLDKISQKKKEEMESNKNGNKNNKGRSKERSNL